MVPRLTITYYALIAYIKQIIRAETPERDQGNDGGEKEGQQKSRCSFK